MDHSSAVTVGTTLLTIQDATGSSVYASPLLAGGSLSTLAGTAGTWRITVSLHERQRDGELPRPVGQL